MAGRKFSTGVDLQGQRGTNAAPATAATDLATLGQLLAYVNGLDWKLHARVASPINLSLTAPGATIDGVAMNAGDRVFLPVQTDATARLTYIWNGASSALTIAPDFVQGELNADATLSISEGATYSSKALTLVTKGPITVGTTSLTWGYNNAAQTYTNGYGLLLASGVFSLDTTKVPSYYKGTIGDGTTLAYTVTHNLAAGADVQPRFVVIATGEEIEADISNRTATAFTVTFGTAPTANGIRVLVVGLG